MSGNGISIDPLLIFLILAIMLFFGTLLIYTRKFGSKEQLLKNRLLPLYSEKKAKDLSSNGERTCKEIMQEIFGKEFVKQRPHFLKNSVTGFNLELDCFNPELKLAVEYNGKQHYEFVPYFHKNKEAFMNQKYRDEMKKRLCAENNITLIEVPYTVELTKIKSYIETVLKSLGIEYKK